MKTLNELQAKRNKLADRVQELRDKFHEQENKWADDSQRAEWKQVNADYDVCVAAMDEIRSFGGPTVRRQRRDLNDPETTARMVEAMQSGSVSSDEEIDSIRSASHPRSAADEQYRECDQVAAAWMRNSYGFPVPPEEWEACERAGFNPGANGYTLLLNRTRPTLGRSLRFAGPAGEMRGLARYPLASGGALVPQGLARNLEVALKDFGPMLATSEVYISQDGRPEPWPTLDDTGNEGVQLGEGGPVDQSAMSFGAFKLEPYKFTSGAIKVSHELLRDAAEHLAGDIGSALGVRLGRIINRRATVGTGAGTMMGIVPASTLGVTAASATVLDPDELIDLIASVDPAYHSSPGVGFMMNQTSYAYLLKLKTGDGQYLIGGAEKDEKTGAKLIRGYPVFINNAMDNAATGTRPVLFGDLSKYKIRIVQGVRLRKLEERYADTDEIGFMGFMEADGGLLDAGTHPVRCLQMA